MQTRTKTRHAAAVAAALAKEFLSVAPTQEVDQMLTIKKRRSYRPTVKIKTEIAKAVTACMLLSRGLVDWVG
jgi:hypothetical protein